jgi:hypothetical protein
MAKHWFLLSLLLLLSSCYSTGKAVKSADPYAAQINWPEAYEPSEARFFVHNDIEISATPEKVWSVLIQAEAWPEWYVGAEDVQIQNSPDNQLVDEAVFTWNTMGLDFESTIREFVPNSRLSWESVRKNIQGYHGWLIIPTPNGCRLITEESQQGWLTLLEKTFQPKKLEKLHEQWLLAIKAQAEQNQP